MAPPSAKRTGFSRRAQYGVFIGYVAAASGVVVGLVLVLLSFFNPPVFAAFRSAVAEATTPISSGLAGLRRAATSPGSLADYFGGADKIRELRTQLAREHAIVTRARMINAENRRLRALLRIRDIEVTPVVAARLVSSTASSTRRFATLNAGRRQGVEPGMPVRGPEGLIGRVIETGFNSARVLLLIDAESIVPVRRTRDNLPAIASGRGDGQLDIRSAGSANAPFQRGDTFVTSGTGGLYPPNIPVARVTQSARDAAPGRMLADPDSLDFALVQRPFRPAPLPERPAAP
ncbi:rod shape-determining protein MreC [Sphingomonas guangdongensis]|uniref:Cell shape-determining protein MreC n=1 Tax=Sphingomonas guangdongensis TaxID=1141890 RepID=A0A285QYM9_9SPHN|nr:rod shape-determining protein MreC [Sphingomonas guangdongensis]SOB87070.1 rod shape-determining protein MreC [Sphingomonas guangdongensis]